MEDPNDIRFPVYEKGGIQTSIGLLGPHSQLICSINVQDKTTRYFKTRNQVLSSFLRISGKLKRWAFGKMKNNGRKERGELCGDFLPGELLRGNDRVIPQFLRRLKNQRVESYIKFRWNEKEPCSRSLYKLTNILCKFVDRRKVFALKKVSDYRKIMKKQTNDETLSEMENMPDTSGRSLSGIFASTPQRRPARSLNVTFVRVNLTPEKVKERSFCKEPPKSRQPKIINIRQIERSPQRTEYRYSSLDSRWKRIQVKHSIHKV